MVLTLSRYKVYNIIFITNILYV